MAQSKQGPTRRKATRAARHQGGGDRARAAFRAPLVQAHLRAGDRRPEGCDGRRGVLAREGHARKTGANVDAAKAVGKLVAQRAVEKGVKDVVFDRGGYRYHGRIKALADAAREGGLKF